MGEFINVLVSKGKSNLIPKKTTCMDSLSVNGILNGLITKVQQAKDMFRESGYSLGYWKGLQFKMCLFVLRVRRGLKIINRMQLMRLRYVCIILIQKHGIFYIRN